MFSEHNVSDNEEEVKSQIDDVGQAEEFSKDNTI
jgi:hypothetical protein